MTVPRPAPPPCYVGGKLPEVTPGKVSRSKYSITAKEIDRSSVQCFPEPISKARQSWGSRTHQCPPQRLQSETEARTGRPAGWTLNPAPSQEALKSHGLSLSGPALDPAVLRSRTRWGEFSGNLQAVCSCSGNLPSLSSGGQSYIL